MDDTFLRAARALADPDQPAAIYALVDALIQDRVGHRQLTLLITEDSDVARVYSTDHAAYPVGGRKPMGPTPWGDLVLTRQQPFLGRTMDDIRWAFFDHELQERLGLGSIINIPVVHGGTTLGTINTSHAEHHYTHDQVPLVAALAPLLIPPFLLARQAALARSTP